MRRISTFTTLGVLIATLGAHPMTATAAKAPHSRHTAHHHVARHTHAARHRKHRNHRKRPTAETRQLRHLVATHAGCLRTVDPMSQRLLALRSGRGGRRHGQRATARLVKVTVQRERLLEQIALLELRGQTGGACAAQSASHTLGPATRLTATAPWLLRGTI